MKYYRRNPGDYLSATRHLSMIEHGAYNLLMDTYYATEDALPADQPSLYRIAGAHTTPERAAVDKIIGLFFKVVDGRYRQERIEREIAAGNEKRWKLAENGAVGGSKKSKLPPENEAIASADAQAIAKQKPKHIQQTTDINKPNGLSKHTSIQAPDWLPSEAWASWRRHRGRKFSVEAETLCLRKLSLMRDEGQDPVAVIEQSITNGWTGLFPLRRDGQSSTNGMSRQEALEARNAATAAAWTPPESRQPKDENGTERV